jgi:hypothetical protein
LYENKNLPFNINQLCNNIFAGARHAVPLPGDPASANFEFPSVVVPAPGMGVYKKKGSVVSRKMVKATIA